MKKKQLRKETKNNETMKQNAYHTKLELDRVLPFSRFSQ